MATLTPAHLMKQETLTLEDLPLEPHKLICSFDRVEAFARAAAKLGLIGLVVEAYIWVASDRCYHVSKDGSFIAYEVSEEN